MSDRKLSPGKRAHLDSPRRARKYDIPSIIAGIGLKPGMAVADIGAGTGFFSIHFSRAVGPAGSVLAVDISREMLDSIGAKVGELGLANVETVLSTENSMPVPDSSVDIAFMSNVLHEVEGPGTLRETHRILRQGGRFAVMDWKKKFELGGAPYSHRLSEDTVKGICAENGFSFTGEFSTGSKRLYGLMFAKI